MKTFLASFVFALSLSVSVSACNGVLDDKFVAGLYVDSITPRVIPATGGTVITVTGKNFDGALKITVGGKPADSVIAQSNEQLSFRAPPGVFGPNDVVVQVGDQRVTVAGGLVEYAASIAFEPRAVAVAGSAISDFAIGDLDGDGLDDLVIGARLTGSLVAYHNDDHGAHFTASAPITGAGTEILAIADADGDGLGDIVTPSAIVLNLGAGLFRAPLPFPVSDSVHFARVADFDGDGKPDLLLNDQAALYVLGVTRDGVTLARTVPIPSPVGFETADLSGDGVGDVVFQDAATDCLSVRLGPTFAATKEGTICDPAFKALASDTGAFLFRDFDGDGKLDLLMESDSSHLLLGHGDGTFAPPTAPLALCAAGTFGGFTPNTTPAKTKWVFADCLGAGTSIFDVTHGPFFELAALGERLKLGDFDGDGGVDSVVLVGDGLSVGFGYAYSPTYAPPFSYDSALFRETLAIADTQRLVTLDGPSASFATLSGGVIELHVRQPSGAMQTVATQSLADLLGSSGYVTAQMLTGDLDGDGDLDLLLQVGSSNQPTTLVPVYRDEAALTIGAPIAQTGNYPDVAVANLQGDRTDEIIMRGADGGYVLSRRSNGTWQQAPFVLYDATLAFADIDGDGYADGITSNGHYHNRNQPGGLSFDAAQGVADNVPYIEYPMGLRAQSIPGGGAMIWVLGGGRLTRTQIAVDGSVVSAVTVATNADVLRIGDVDGDGLADALLAHQVSSSSSSASSVVYTARTETLTTPTPIAGILNTEALELADVDGDGTADIVHTGYYSLGRVFVVRNQSE